MLDSVTSSGIQTNHSQQKEFSESSCNQSGKMPNGNLNHGYRSVVPIGDAMPIFVSDGQAFIKLTINNKHNILTRFTLPKTSRCLIDMPYLKVALEVNEQPRLMSPLKKTMTSTVSYDEKCRRITIDNNFYQHDHQCAVLLQLPPHGIAPVYNESESQKKLSAQALPSKDATAGSADQLSPKQAVFNVLPASHDLPPAYEEIQSAFDNTPSTNGTASERSSSHQQIEVMKEEDKMTLLAPNENIPRQGESTPSAFDYFVSSDSAADVSLPGQQLFEEVNKGDIEKVASLFEDGISPDIQKREKSSREFRGITGYTPLYDAIESGDKNMVNFLLQNHANPAVKAYGKVTALTIAVEKGDTGIMDVLSQYAVGESVDMGAENALFEVVSWKQDVDKVQLGIADRLINKFSANINQHHECTGKTALHSAATYGRPEMCDWLVRHSAELDVVDLTDWTPLHRAAYAGNTENVKVLLEAGADVTTGCFLGGDVLSAAVKSKNKTLIDYLLKYGAEKGINWDFNAALSNLACCKDEALAMKYASIFITQNGADPNYREQPSKKPVIYWAIICGHKQLCKLLINHGADVNLTVDSSGMTVNEKMNLQFN